MVSMFESMAYERKVILKSNIEKGISFYGNAEDVQHILSTLLDNAIHHTKEQGEVEVTFAKEKNDLVGRYKTKEKKYQKRNERRSLSVFIE